MKKNILLAEARNPEDFSKVSVALYSGKSLVWSGEQTRETDAICVGDVISTLGVPHRSIEVTHESLMEEWWPQAYPGQLVEVPE